MTIDMEEKEATGNLTEQDLALELGKQSHDQEQGDVIANSKLVQDSNDILPKVDRTLSHSDQNDIYYNAAEDADDEIGSDDDMEETQPLIIRKAQKAKSCKDVKQGMHFVVVVVNAERIKADSPPISSSVNKPS